MAFGHNNTDGKGYISQISLPNGQTYHIHDENAIHDLEDLGLSTPLNFKGIVDTESDLISEWGAPLFSTSLEYGNFGSNSASADALPGTFELDDLAPTFRIIYEEKYGGADAKLDIYEYIIDTNLPQNTSWTGAEIFNSRLDFLDGGVQLHWDIDSQQFSLIDSETAETSSFAKNLFSAASSHHAKVTIQRAGAPTTGHKHGDVYLVRQTGQEYVYLEETNDAGVKEGRWEPLGSVHDAASSTHTHNITSTITASSGTTKFVTAIAAPTSTLAYAKVDSVATIQKSGSNGTAPAWTASVINGVLTIGWQPGEITTLPTFGKTTASRVDVTINGSLYETGSFTAVSSITPTTSAVSVSGNLNVTTTEPNEGT